jgi:predicted transcriptional regulator
MSKPGKGSCETAILVLLSLSRGAGSRKKILTTLLSRPKNCSQIAKEVELNWWTVQKHLRTLMKENVIKSSAFGNSKFYKLSSMGEDAIKAIQSSSGKISDLKSHGDLP